MTSSRTSRPHTLAALVPALVLALVGATQLVVLTVVGPAAARVPVLLTLAAGLLASAPLGLLAARLTGPPTPPAEAPAEEPLVDPLTGAATRHALDRDLPGMVDTARRHGRPLTLLLVGLDGHGDLEINEGRGRADAALHVAAEILTEGRPGDRVYRLTGTEFAVVLPETATVGAHVAAERMRIDVRRRIAGVTASIGLTTLDLLTPDVESLLSRTAAGLDAARRRGGDLVVESSDLRRDAATGDTAA